MAGALQQGRYGLIAGRSLESREITGGARSAYPISPA
jgi:hypothetical protein